MLSFDHRDQGRALLSRAGYVIASWSARQDDSRDCSVFATLRECRRPCLTDQTRPAGPRRREPRKVLDGLQTMAAAQSHHHACVVRALRRGGRPGGTRSSAGGRHGARRPCSPMEHRPGSERRWPARRMATSVDLCGQRSRRRASVRRCSTDQGSSLRQKNAADDSPRRSWRWAWSDVPRLPGPGHVDDHHPRRGLRQPHQEPPDLDPAKLTRTRELMSTAIRDALFVGREPLVDVLDRPGRPARPRRCDQGPSPVGRHARQRCRGLASFLSHITSSGATGLTVPVSPRSPAPVRSASTPSSPVPGGSPRVASRRARTPPSWRRAGRRSGRRARPPAPRPPRARGP